jgi:hypothetical protein
MRRCPTHSRAYEPVDKESSRPLGMRILLASYWLVLKVQISDHGNCTE